MIIVDKEIWQIHYIKHSWAEKVPAYVHNMYTRQKMGRKKARIQKECNMHKTLVSIVLMKKEGGVGGFSEILT